MLVEYSFIHVLILTNNDQLVWSSQGKGWGSKSLSTRAALLYVWHLVDVLEMWEVFLIVNMSGGQYECPYEWQQLSFRGGSQMLPPVCLTGECMLGIDEHEKTLL